ncbi:hypothetical protein N7486_002404 [Penicillium sp. IBT 16267x]|nr:hypothetical protein N7486_002404 [Penicillium sp. IBT 16267x]
MWKSSKHYFGLRGGWLAFWITLASGADMTLSGYDVAGIGNAPIWQVETSKVQWRGKLVALENCLLLVGFSLANWLKYGLSFANGPVSWRFHLSFQLIFNIMIFCTVLWLPESPRRLIAHDNPNETLRIIADLEGQETTDAFVQLQLSEIQYSVEYERSNSVGFCDIIRGRAREKSGTNTVRRLVLGMGAQAFQQFTGINVTSYYLPTVLTTSVGLMAFFFLYYVFFGIGLQGVPWLYPTEINSLTTRTKGAALGAATNWILNFMVVEITPIGIQNLGWKFYIIWVVLNATIIPTVYLFYPETAGPSLEDMDDYYHGNPPLWRALTRKQYPVSAVRGIKHEMSISCMPKGVKRRSTLRV